MKVYSPSDIADLLNIKESTLRKYCLLLEDKGYTFQKNNRQQRFYSDRDVITLRKFVTFKDNGMTLKEATESVMLWHKGNADPNESENAIQHHNSDIAELKDMIYKQNELIKALSNKLDHQQEYIDKRLNERDNLLMKSLNEMLENRKQIATAEKKGFFARLFNK